MCTENLLGTNHCFNIDVCSHPLLNIIGLVYTKGEIYLKQNETAYAKQAVQKCTLASKSVVKEIPSCATLLHLS